MNKKLENQIYKKYPELYRQRNLPMTHTCMCWGICTGDGWYKIIDKLSAQLTEYAKEVGAKIECEQVKEKFGTLRVYLNVHNDITDKFILEAERASAKTCEDCGEPGKINKGSWLSVKCPKCRKESKRG